MTSSPQWRGRDHPSAGGRPSRSKLPAYRALQQQTLAEVERINGKFGTVAWRPIVLVGEHQEPAQVFELYRAADFCLVNSLHDGMNLVAKEFVAAREDEDGVLILSTFAGASRELVEALLINPFDVSETAAAIEMAMSMDRDERRERMRLMRRTVKEKQRLSLGGAAAHGYRAGAAALDADGAGRSWFKVQARLVMRQGFQAPARVARAGLRKRPAASRNVSSDLARQTRNNCMAGGSA